MYIKKLSLREFRNFRGAEIEPHPRMNVITGANAQGKTNLLEAVCYLSTVRPIRPAKDGELVLWGAEFADIGGEICAGGRGQTLSVSLPAAGRKRLLKNGVCCRSAAEFAGTLRSVLFSPDDLLLLKEGAAPRRRLMDLALCQLRPAYYSALSEYSKAHAQKNRILKDWDEKPSLLELLPAYNRKMAQLGAQIISFRGAYVKKLCAGAAGAAAALSGGRDALSFEYKTVSTVKDPLAPPGEIEAEIMAHQASHRGAELASKTCLSGPHRDDLVFYINGRPAKTFASQGQTRTAVLSLKLAERDIFHADGGEYPVLLLDDVLSELDAERQSYVLGRISKGQVFITCCGDFEGGGTPGRSFSIENGEVISSADFG